MEKHVRYIKHKKGVFSLQFKKRGKWRDFKELHGCYGGSIWMIYHGSKKECLQRFLLQVNIRVVTLYEHPTIRIISE